MRDFTLNNRKKLNRQKILNYVIDDIQSYSKKYNVSVSESMKDWLNERNTYPWLIDALSEHFGVDI